MLKTDSATVYDWLKVVVDKTHNIRSRALGEVLIRWRLDTMRELIQEENLVVKVELVGSMENWADQLTRVPGKWLHTRNEIGLVAASAQGRPTFADIRDVHNHCHFGVERTLKLARARFGEQMSKKIVKKVVMRRDHCARIDPVANFRWERGTTMKTKIWEHLALDIIHVKGQPYLSCIDCASRFTVWRALRNESAKEVCAQVNAIFAELGPLESVLSDNGAVFLSSELRCLLETWDVQRDTSCAYRAQGNGLVERVHRTIKQMVARTGQSVEEMTFWLNATTDECPVSPFKMIFAAKPPLPSVMGQQHEMEGTWPAELTEEICDTRKDVATNPFVVGDSVYLKQGSRCDQPWSGPHRVTCVTSSVGVVLDGDGIPWHVSHIRRVPKVGAVSSEHSRSVVAMDPNEEEENTGDQAEEVCESERPGAGDDMQPMGNNDVPARDGSRRWLPCWMADYYQIG